MINKREVGFWALMIPGLLILLMLIFGQMMSFVLSGFVIKKRGLNAI